MRNAGTQLRSWNAALIPPKGVLLGAINPAIDAAWVKYPKRNPANMPGMCALNFHNGANAADESSEKNLSRTLR